MNSNLPLTIDNLSHTIGNKQIVQQVFFSVHAGTRLFLLGRNGAGKTTIFSLITTLYTKQALDAQIMIFGTDNSKRRALKDVGIVFQQRTVDADLTALQNLRYFALICGMDKATTERRIAEEMNEFGMTEVLDRKMRQLSGGQVRCVELARALLPEPPLLLLDEPTVGIDFDSRQKLLARIRTLSDTKNVAVLWTTHNMDEVLPDDAVVIIHKGKMLFTGSAQALMQQQKTAHFADAFSSITDNAPTLS